MLNGLLMVIIFVIVTAFGIHEYDLTTAANKTSNAISEVAMVISGTERMANGNPNYTGLDTAVAIQNGVFPSNMASPGVAAAVNGWGGAVHDDAAATGFTVTFDGVPETACPSLASGYAGSDLLSVSINGSVLTPPVTSMEATADCTQTGSGPSGGNTVAFNVE
ncbi:type 4 pilus major pilin [Acidiferrobacter sp.]|uniref:type 4 pilus major pilin n=1 Tax=Acidiferrobacter sp. TaxID=1872107 RepID=UPI0026298E6A|nr:type 4 pilus major pilin [Acidiferrobacter sp.]